MQLGGGHRTDHHARPAGGPHHPGPSRVDLDPERYVLDHETTSMDRSTSGGNPYSAPSGTAAAGADGNGPPILPRVPTPYEDNTLVGAGRHPFVAVADQPTSSFGQYSDEAGVVLEPTKVADAERIVDAIDELQPSNSLNAVILASDGVANVGLTDPDGLAGVIQDRAADGIHLVTVGYGMGNDDDDLMDLAAKATPSPIPTYYQD